MALASMPDRARLSRTLEVSDNLGADTIDVFNVHTAAGVASFTLPGSAFAQMMTSPDGKALYVLDAGGDSLMRVLRGGDVMRVFDIQNGLALRESRPIGKLMAGTSGVFATGMVYARLNGVGIVITNNGLAYRADDGKLLRERMGELTYRPLDCVSDYGIDYVNSYLAVTGDGTMTEMYRLVFMPVRP